MGVQLPSGYSPLRDVLEEKARAGSMINVVGLVKDFRRPIPTRGSDYKSEITLYDLSTESEGGGTLLSIFGPENGMPEVNVRDVVLLRQVRVQRYRSNPLSLIMHHSTALYVYSADRIPAPPKSAQAALMPPKKAVSRQPSEEEHACVSRLYHEISKDALPSQVEFERMAIQSMNVKKDKFSLLKDIAEGRFYDLLVRVVREPYPLYDKVTMHVTDYTENKAFFNFAYDGPSDPYGYTTNDGSSSKWLGPYGKKTMQLSCFEPHASFIRDDVKAGQWLFLRNVQIKVGRNGQHLEGYLREERGGAFAGRVNVEVIDVDDSDELDPKLKDALRRWRDYEKSKKAQLKEIQAKGAGGAGIKRKLREDGSARPNAKERRRIKRLAAEQRVKEASSKVEDYSELNEHVSSERHDQPTSLISAVLEPVYYDTKIDGEEAKLPLPFVCARYQAIVRVTDFRPNRLEDFACSRRQVAFDKLSDYSGGESSDSDAPPDSNPGMDLDDGRIWEWRFALQLEDAATKVKPASRVWVVLDNAEAQYLTGLDASDLHRDADNLNTLREKLFTLWGDLEEHKAKQQAQYDELASRQPGQKPPLDDSDQEGDGGDALRVSNKPFTCCIQQYGVQVAEPDALKADAGDGKRWERVFSLFGTKICS